ncbi:hypothetical protein KIM372_06040 [Bombiscardovia nodaiensis]|uniref:Uncharacterized protein n=1 Tax=Bombiscardovia nodaiensis TaxID=2932181 RepID=A0ABN6SC66_9BIFI|nr:hypothetical protein KIM372_06040 [Bombiscardovia nodaiensis]
MLLLSAPALLRWVPIYLILGALSFLAANLHQERSLWGNAVVVLAASGICLLASSLGGIFANNLQVSSPGKSLVCQTDYAVYCWADGWLPAQVIPQVGLAGAAIFALAEFGSVLFVKTMIRERGSHPYYYLSVGWNIVLVGLALFTSHALGYWPAAVAVILLARAVLIPVLAPKRTPIIYIGLEECLASLLVLAAVLSLAPLAIPLAPIVD